MAETNGLSPPLFREPLVERSPLTMSASWQRWLSAFWQQQAALWDKAQQPHVLGTGVASKLAVWQDASTLTADSLLHYDAAQDWLGIGTATPTAPLTFSNALGPKIDVWKGGTGRFGVGLQDGQIQIYANVSGQVRLGHTDAAGTTFTPRFDVLPTYTYSSVPMTVGLGLQAGYTFTTDKLYAAGLSRFNSGLGIAIDAGSYALHVSGVSYFTGATAVAWAHQANYDLTTNRFYAAGLSRFNSAVGIAVAPGTYTLDVNGTARISGQSIFSDARPVISANVMSNMYFNKATHYGLGIMQVVNDTGSGQPVLFYNNAGAIIGFIGTTGTTTSYNTSSDARLKIDVEALKNTLTTVLRLAPVQFRWKADGSVGHGLIAQAVQAVVPEAVCGGEEGSDLPMGIDYGKLVPWVVGAVQTLAERVQALEGA